MGTHNLIYSFQLIRYIPMTFAPSILAPRFCQILQVKLMYRSCDPKAILGDRYLTEDWDQCFCLVRYLWLLLDD